jgi:hypothetical protein
MSSSTGFSQRAIGSGRPTGDRTEVYRSNQPGPQPRQLSSPWGP